MDQPTAELLVSEDGARALAVAAAQPDPTSLAAAAALRTHFPADLAAAALQQIALRRKGETKLGPLAQRLFLADAGLQQATRPVLARWRAGLIAAAAPAAKVADLGCGLGIDALALLDAGLRIRPVELDPVTAVLASANLGSRWNGPMSPTSPSPTSSSTAIQPDGPGPGAAGGSKTCHRRGRRSRPCSTGRRAVV